MMIKEPPAEVRNDLDGATRDEVADYQARKLRTTTSWIAERSDYWRERFAAESFDPATVEGPEDLHRAPTLWKREYFRSLEEDREGYGGFLCHPMDEILANGAIVFRTTGTSGMQGRFVNTHEGFQLFGDEYARVVWEAGARPGDFVLVAFPLSSWAAGWGLLYACQRLGCTFIAGGAPLDTAARLGLLQEYRPTIAVMTPSYAVTLGSAAAEHGLQLGDLRLNGLILTGESYSPGRRDRIEDLWGVEGKSRNAYGISEGGPLCSGFECSQQDGIHLNEDVAVQQFWKPDSDEPVGEGEVGEYVFTHLDQRVMATWFNFRTRDAAIFSDEPCACGRTSRRMWVKDRLDDMVKVKGVNIFATTVEGILKPIVGLGDEYKLIVETVNDRDQVTVQVESEPGMSSEQPAEELRQSLKSQIGVTLKVDVVEPGTLPRTELKARRWDDRRPKD